MWMKFVVLLAFIATHAWASDSALDSYELGPGDSIRIVVYGEDDMSMDVLLPNGGTIDFPYLGELQVSGQTIHKLKQQLTEGLKGDYLIDPKVMVSMLAFRQIYVNGEVRRPGGYPYQPGLSIDKAIALAGGFTERADKNEIVISRKQALGRTSENSAELATKVTPGDIIVVKRSFF